MISSRILRLANASASPVVALRGVIVGINFLVMIGLAAWLGLAVYGQLVVMWGLALLVSGVIGVGAPLLLLRALSDGGKLAIGRLCVVTFFYPAGLALIGWLLMMVIMPAQPWAVIFGTGFAIHLMQCLASIMRALGSMSWSMFLRDSGPQLALGLAGFAVGAQSGVIIGATTGILICAIIPASVWSLRHPQISKIIGPSRHKRPFPASLWATSVLGMGAAQVDIIVGGAILSAEQIGLYALLRRITNLIVLPVSVATWVTSVPIAAAHGAGDGDALRRHSAHASQIAIIPGAVLLLVALLGLGLLQLPMLQLWDGPGTQIYMVLLCGALVQVSFAASFTVATLCQMAHWAACARVCSIGVYLLLVGFAPTVGPLFNGLAYVVGVTSGAIFLWWIIVQRLGVDTSTLALLGQNKGVSWKTS